MSGAGSLVIPELGPESGTEPNRPPPAPQRRVLLTALAVAILLCIAIASGMILGALLAAGAAGKFKPTWRIWRSHFAASVVGGLLLGYGARLAYGCNIGAFFSGIASGSLHGWLWIVFALFGTWAGLQQRPAFGLSDAPPSKR